MKDKDKLKKSGRIIVFILLVFLLLIDIVNIFNVFMKDKITLNFFNFKPFIVEANLKNLDIEYGDMAIIKNIKLEDFKPGDKVVYRVGDKATIKTIEDIEIKDGKTQILTNNSGNKLNTSLIEGKYILRIPLLGAFILFLHTPFGVLVLFSIILLIFTSFFQIKKRSKHAVC